MQAINIDGPTHELDPQTLLRKSIPASPGVRREFDGPTRYGGRPALISAAPSASRAGPGLKMRASRDTR